MSDTVIAALAPLPPGVWLRRPNDHLPFPLSRPDCRLFAHARHALHRALGELVEPGSEILAPAFHHGSEIEAFERVSVSPRYYGASGSLVPDEDELEALLTPKTRALH